MFKDTSRYPELPGVENGYELDPIKSFFSFVLPTGADKTNLVQNPSGETNTTGYTGVSGTLASDSTQQRYGLNSFKLTPTANSGFIRYDTGLTLVSGTIYYFSVDVLAQAGVPMQLQFTDTADALVGGAYSFVATGMWQRVSVAYRETANTTRRVRVIQNNSTNRQPFYTDGWQVEQDSLTTYIDGDQIGFVRNRLDYYWVGTPHGSASVRIGQSRHGGRVIPLSDFGYHVTGILGLGMGGRINQILPIARGGAFYQGSAIGDRQFALTGILYGNSLVDLQRKRKQIIDILKDDVVAPDQPLKVLYQLMDDDANPLTPLEEIVCVVDGDPLVGKTDNLFGEAMALTFRLLNTYVAQEIGEVGAALGFNSAVTNANEILMRTAAGVWQAMGTGASGTASLGNPGTYSILVGNDGSIYATGDFTAMGGGANTNGIARWNGSAWVAMGTGGLAVGTGSVASGFTLAIGPDGSIYIGGQFATVGGVAATACIGKWNGAAWSALGTGASATNVNVNALVFGPTGILYAGGSFALMGGIANTIQIAKWNGAAWSALGTGTNGLLGVNAAVIGSDGLLYIAGDFTTANGVTVNHVAKWTGTTFVSLNGGTNGTVYALAVGPDGALYAGGAFSTAGGVACLNIAKWNGVSWSPLGSGVTGGIQQVYLNGLNWVGNQLYISGTLTSGGGVIPPTSLIIWNGSAYVIPDMILPGTPRVFRSLYDRAGNFYVGFSTTGTATVAVSNSVSNLGSSSIGPKLIITGPGILWKIANITTGVSLYLNLTLLAGETATLNLADPTAITFVSSFRGSILNTIAAGSTPSSFLLASGPNLITFFMTGTTGASSVTLNWRTTHHSIDGAIPVSLGL